MIRVYIANEIARATELYAKLGMNLLGALHVAMNDQRLSVSSVASELEQNTLSSRELYAEKIEGIIVRAIDEVYEAAITDLVADLGIESQETFRALMDENLEAYISSVRGTALQDASNQLRRDQMQVLEFFQSFSAEVGLLMLRKRMKKGEASKIISTKRPAPESKFIDRAGRRWKAIRFLSSMMNDLLYTVYREVFTHGAIMNGAGTVVVMSNNETDGTILSLMPDSQGMTLEYFRSEKTMRDIFHPNSQALVRVI